MILLSFILLLSGFLLGTGVTLAVQRHRNNRIQAESWQAARRFYNRIQE